MRSCFGITKKIKFCKKPTGGKLLCAQHQPQPIYFIIIALTGVLFSYISGILPKPPLPWEKKVCVSPSSITLHTGKWVTKTPLSICNQKREPVHSVWVKIAFVEDGINAESVQITIPDKTTDLDAHVGNVFFSGDTYRINAIDSSGHEGVFIVLHTIPPKSCREFIVSGSIKKQSHATVSVTSYTDVPIPIEESEGKAMFLFTPPEDIKLKSVDVIVNKKQS